MNLAIIGKKEKNMSKNMSKSKFQKKFKTH